MSDITLPCTGGIDSTPMTTDQSFVFQVLCLGIWQDRKLYKLHNTLFQSLKKLKLLEEQDLKNDLPLELPD